MKTLIVYYSRTGTTEKLARALAHELDAEIVKIACPRYAPASGGWLRYLRAGFDSLRGRLWPITVPRLNFADYDLLLIGTPIWTSYPAVPMRSFLTRQINFPARVALFVTSGGHSPAVTAARMVSDLLPAPLEATLSVSESRVKKNAYLKEVRDFAQRLKGPAAPGVAAMGCAGIHAHPGALG